MVLVDLDEFLIWVIFFFVLLVVSISVVSLEVV